MVSPLVLPAVYGIVALLVGIASTVLLHSPVLGALPANEWSPIIAWVLAGGVSYIVVVPLVSAVIMLGLGTALDG